MNENQQASMAEATRLTRAARVAEATALIQQTLGGGNGVGSTPQSHRRLPSLPALRRPAMAHPGVPQPGVPQPGVPYPGVPHPGVPRPAGRPSGPRRPDPVPQGPGRFVEATYANAAGRRRYKVYVPTGAGEGVRLPVVVMLHGGSQTADDFAAGTAMNTLAERENVIVVYPEQDSGANSGRYWNWFEAAHQVRGTGEPSLIAGITAEVVQAHGADGERVYVAGLSAGGAMAAVMAATYPDVYAAVGVHSGLPYAVASDLPSALAAMAQGRGPVLGPPGAVQPADAGRRRRPPVAAVPLIVFHGDQDRTVSPVNADLLAQAAVRAFEEPSRGADSPRPAQPLRTTGAPASGARAFTRLTYCDAHGRPVVDQWTVHGAGHAWSGGNPSGSYTDAAGPDASAEFLRFFRLHAARDPGQPLLG